MENEKDFTLPERINGRSYWRIGERLIPAVHGAADPPTPKPPEGDDIEPAVALTREDVIQIVNAAVTNHQKRQAASLEKLIADRWAQLSTKTEEPKGDKPKGVSDQIAADEQRRRDQEMAEIKRMLQDEQKARKAVEEASRQKDAQAQLRMLLEGANVRKDLLDVAVGHLSKVTNALRFNEDGSSVLAVKRSRTKGAQADEMLFDDLKVGVEDWAKSDEAKAFLAPPNTGISRQPNGAPKAFTVPVTDEDRTSRILDLLQTTNK